jgi:hypothetical protein
LAPRVDPRPASSSRTHGPERARLVAPHTGPREAQPTRTARQISRLASGKTAGGGLRNRRPVTGRSRGPSRWPSRCPTFHRGSFRPI